MPTKVEEVYARFDAGLRSFISARVGDPDVAEDVLQEVYRIARNTVYGFYRTKRPAQDLDELSPVSPDPTEDAFRERLSKTVHAVLEALPPEHREALRLTEYEGLTQRELANKLSINVSGAKSRVQRARSRLKTLLLDCCHFELDRRGKVINYYGKNHDR